MALEQNHKDAMNVLDGALRGEQSSAFAQAALTEDWDEYSPWYARLLSSLVLLTAGERIVFAQGLKAYDESRARVLVFTGKLIIVAEIDDVNGDQIPQPTALSRLSIRSLQVAAKMRIDQKGSSALGWPGTLRFAVSYTGIKDTIEFEAPGTDRSGNAGVGQELLVGLRFDLNAVADAGAPK